MNIQAYNVDQKDTLSEVVNIAMGRAGASLARILNVFVHLSVPKIELVEADNLLQAFSSVIGDPSRITAVRQSFYYKFQGESIVIFNQSSCHELALLMDYGHEPNEIEKQEILLEVANILSGACINGISEQLGKELVYSAPHLMAIDEDINDVLAPDKLPWSIALIVEVNFTFENSDFKSHLLILMAEEHINSLRISLDKYLESI